MKHPGDRSAPESALDRRHFLALVSALGAGAALPAALAAEGSGLTEGSIAEAERLIGVSFTEGERAMMKKGVEDQLERYEALHQLSLPNSVPPAARFFPFEAEAAKGKKPEPFPVAAGAPSRPADPDELAFLPAVELGRLVRARKVKSVELTHLYLERLRRFDPVLQAVITLTEELALRQAEAADAEIAKGIHRGPLHGVPWGAKDLLAARGYPTTWGSAAYKTQTFEEDATVVDRLAAAGAVLVAKLSLGELAMGDVWFGGTTKNPWKVDQGSSGSSAGVASATVAGLVGFGVGSETLGSIVSPSTRCGATGLRPTFGRVPRTGAMALSWSMDKLGPLCRSAEDCAAVFSVIHGPDGRDGTVVDRPFHWNPKLDLKSLKVGYLPALYEKEPEKDQEEWHAFDLAALETLRGLGITLTPIELPDLPYNALRVLLTAEAAAAFDELTRSNRDDLLVQQTETSWPNVFRVGQTIPAVAYIQASRARTLAIRAMEKTLAGFDAYLAPTFGNSNLLLTNLTGHPAVVLPDGYRKDGTPTSLTITGKLYGEATILAIAAAFQGATDFHRRHPKLPVGKSAAG
jgi:Asp-tRNA(Asn)/Glu-tRNA(Gln) amidotransferase A subunit family amidase